MGKTYKRNQEYRPKQHGKIFVKNKNRAGKKNRHDDLKEDLNDKNFDRNYDTSFE